MDAFTFAWLPVYLKRWNLDWCDDDETGDSSVWDLRKLMPHFLKRNLFGEKKRIYGSMGLIKNAPAVVDTYQLSHKSE